MTPILSCVNSLPGVVRKRALSLQKSPISLEHSLVRGHTGSTIPLDLYARPEKERERERERENEGEREREGGERKRGME